MYIYEDPWHLKARQLEPRARNSPLINVFIQQRVRALVCPRFSNCPFWRCCCALNSKDAHWLFPFFSYLHRKENNGAHFPVRKDKGESEQFKICINIDLNLVPEINMCKGGKEKQLSGGNQKWSMKLMKQRCHRLIQLSFQFPWQSSVIVPTIFSAGEEKKENMGGGGDCEIVPNLLEDLLHQGRACAVTCKKIGRVKGRSLEFTELLACWDAAKTKQTLEQQSVSSADEIKSKWFCQLANNSSCGTFLNPSWTFFFFFAFVCIQL